MIGDISGANAAGANSTAAAAQSAFDQMGSDAFLQLLVAQLRYQNPLEPTDQTAMLQQTAMFTQVETLKQIATTQQQLMGFQEVVLASSLVGKEVSAITPDGAFVEGTVDEVLFTADGPQLVVGGRQISLDDTSRVGGAAAQTPAPPATPPPADPPITA